MRWWLFIVIITVILTSFSSILYAPASSAITGRNYETTNAIHNKNMNFPQVRANTHLDWNGSFPYNQQALPFVLNAKINSSAVGDINNDNRPDVAFGSYLADKVFLYINSNGTLNITPTEIISSNNGIYNPTDVAIVSGKIAVACHNTVSGGGTTNYDSIKIFSYPSLANITLKPSQNIINLGLTLKWIAVGDFNSDGKEDIAAAFSSSTARQQSYIAVYNGPFTDSQTPDYTISTDSNLGMMVVGDFDGQNGDDLAAIVDGGTKVMVYYQKSTGDLNKTGEAITTDSANYLAAYDLDGDSEDELLVANGQSGTVGIYHAVHAELPSNPTLNITQVNGVSAIAAGDFNHDGAADIILGFRDVINNTLDRAKYMRIYNGPWNYAGGDVSSPSRTIFAGYNIKELYTTDFNGDGSDDLLVCAVGAPGDRPSVPYVLYQRDGYLKGISDESLYGLVYPTGIALADFNGDGLEDIAIADTALNKTLIFYNRGYGYPLVPDTSLDVYGNPYCIATGFIDGDNKPDLVITHATDGNVTVIPSTTYTPINLTTNMNTTNRVVLGDIDNDSVDDIIVNSINDPEIDIFRTGSGLSDGSTPSINITLPEPSVDIAIIHLKNDSLPALAVLYQDKLQILEQTSVGNFTLKETVPIDSNYVATSMAIGDFDGNGQDDIILVAKSNSGEFSAYGILLQSNGTFPTTPQYSGRVGGYAYSVTTGDFNDDGMTDFAIPTTMNLITVGYFTGTNFEYDYLATNMNPINIASLDLNGDGKDDFVVATHGPTTDSTPKEMDMVDVYYQKDTPPIANISGPDELYEGNYINLTGENSTDTKSDISTLNYTWFLENGTNRDLLGYGVNLSYFAKTQGNYTFILEVRDKEGLNGFATKNVTVLDTVPEVNFTYTPRWVTEGETVNFTAEVSSYDSIASYFWNFGDGSYSKLENPSHVFKSNGTYIVTLYVNDSDGSNVSSSQDVIVQDTSPTCDFEYAPTVGTIPYEGIPIHFKAIWSSYDPVVNWTWYFGTDIMYGKSVNYTFLENGNYTVELVVMDSDGSIGSKTHTIYVRDTQPVVNFTYSPSELYVGEAVNFTAEVSSYDSIASYFWNFGDGSYSQLKNPSHVFKSNGTYIVTLYVNDSDGSNVSFSRTLTVHHSPLSVSFTYTNATEGEPVFFNATITTYASVVSIKWEFGDGNISEDDNPPPQIKELQVQHVYAKNGTYLVRLTVKDDEGKSATAEHQILINPSFPHVVLKVDGPTVVNEDQTIVLNASGSTSYGGIKEYLWFFKYGNTFGKIPDSGNGPIVNTSFPEMGNYTVIVRVVNNEGNAASASVDITVKNVPPVANFTYNISINTVILNASSSYDTPSDKETLIYTWDFGDGSHKGHGIVVEHNYNKPGKYTITLTVTDNDGATSKISKTIVIKSVPPVTTSGTNKDMLYLLLILIPLIGGLIAAFLYMKGKRAVIDDVYLISDSGLLIHHSTRRLKPDMDEDILSSMLIAIQEFVKDAFKGESDVALKSMDFGEKKIQIHKGKHLYLAVVSTRNVGKKLEEKIGRILDEIERKYEDVLKDWNGDTSAFRGVEELLKKIWE